MLDVDLKGKQATGGRLWKASKNEDQVVAESELQNDIVSVWGRRRKENGEGKLDWYL